MRKFLLYILFSLPLLTVAQKRNYDSIYQIISKSRLDSNYLHALTVMAERYAFSKPDSAIWYTDKTFAAGQFVGANKYKAIAGNLKGYAFYMKADYYKSIEAFKTYYHFASLDNNQSGMAHAINNQGNVYIELGNYNQALQYYQDALQIRKQTANRFDIAQSYTNIGYVYKDIGDYEKAISNFLFALKEFEQLQSKIQIAAMYNYLGIVYQRKNELKTAIDYHLKALSIQKAEKDINGMGVSLQSLAMCYSDLKDYDKAETYYNESIELYQKNNDRRQLSLAYSNIGDMYNKKELYTKASEYFQKSILINQQTNNHRNSAGAWLGAAVAAIHTNQLSEAKAYLDSAELVIIETNKRNDKKSFFSTQSEYYKAIGKSEEALKSYILFSNEKDSILNEENVRSMNNLQIVYETDKKELKIALLHKSDSLKSLQILTQQLALEKNLFELTRKKLDLSLANLLIAKDSLLLQTQNTTILRQQYDSSKRIEQINDLHKKSIIQQLELRNQQLEINKKNTAILLISVFTILTALLFYSLYKRYRLQQQNKMQQAIFQQQNLATKAVLEAEEKERQRIAVDLHDGIGQMMSAAKMNLSAFEDSMHFETTDQKNKYEKIIGLIDESCKELRVVSHNMMPNALLKNGLSSAVKEFIDKIDSNVIRVNLHTEGLNERLDSNTEIVLYRVIQEAVNNVIKHAGANVLDISLIKDAGGIDATIEDNGKGFDTKQLKQFKGIGLANIAKRIEYLKGNLDFSSSPGKGTLVAIHIPLSSTQAA